VTSTARFDNWQNRLGTQAGSIDASGNVTFDNNVTAGSLIVGGTSLESRIAALEADNANIVAGQTYYFTDNSQYAPEYGSPYYRTSLYTVSAPAGKSISTVHLSVLATSPSRPAWVTMYSKSASQYTYYVWSNGASAGYVQYILDCR